MSQDLLITLVPYIVPVIIIFATSIAAAAYQHLLCWLPPNQRDMLQYAVVNRLKVRPKVSVDSPCVEPSPKFFRGRRFDTTSTL